MGKRKVVIRVVVLLFMTLTAAGAGVYFGVLNPMFHEINKDSPQEVLDQPKEEKMPLKFNILIIGTDKGKALTDVMMLASVDSETHKIHLISLMRDTRVKVESYFTKLNSVYRHDKLDGLIGAVKELTGSPVNYYIMMDFEGFRNIIDTLGGVEFNVPQRMKYTDRVQGLKIDLQPGMQVLDGNKAEQLVRFRRYIEGDVQRTRVQQDFVKALFEQKKDASYLLKAPELFQELSKSCKTNITLNILLKNINEINNMSQYDLETHKMPGEGTYVGDVSYFLPYLDESYPVFQNYFLGTGEPSSKKYTDMTGAKWPKGWSHNTKEETTSKKS